MTILTKLTKFRFRFAKFVNFAISFFALTFLTFLTVSSSNGQFGQSGHAFSTSSIVPDDIRILLIFHFCCTLATANMLSIVSDSLDIP